MPGEWKGLLMQPRSVPQLDHAPRLMEYEQESDGASVGRERTVREEATV